MGDTVLVNYPQKSVPKRVGLQGICAVVCTKDRPKQLRRALYSLLEQTRLPEEILVVDNAPSADHTRRLVANEFSNVGYVLEPREGLDFARNRALAATSKDIVAFLDDDAVADPDWVEIIQGTFQEYTEAGICTGHIAPLHLETPGQIAFESNGGLMAHHAEHLRLPTDAWRYGWKWRSMPLIALAVSLGSGCNLAVRRNLALQIGGFDEALDLGSVMPGGGDHDMVWRMLEFGAEVVYQPKARVRHEHRRELTAVYEQIIGHHISLIGFLTKAVQCSDGKKRFAALAFLSWRLMKPGVRILRRVLGRDALPAPVLMRLWWHCWRGLGTYSMARRVAAQRASDARCSTCR